MNPPEVLAHFYSLLGHVVLLPIPLGEKGPKIKGWNAITYEATQKPAYREGLFKCINRGGNIGVVLGPASDNLQTIDLDDDELAGMFLADNPALLNTLRTHGARGFNLWGRPKPGTFFPNGKAVYPLKTPEGNTYGEFRCGGGELGAQTVIWGVHPNGNNYSFDVERPVTEINFASIKWLGPAPAEEGEEDKPPQEKPPEWLYPRKVALLNPYLPPQIMQGMLYQGCRFVFGGSPKAKKSWLLMQVCYCVANGLPFLGIKTTKGKVVYINLELLEGEARKRFHDIQRAFGSGELDNIEVIQLRDKRLSELNLAQLKDIIANAAFSLSAFDPIYKLLDGRDERVGVEVAPVLALLAGICETAKTSIGYAQHFAKGNQALKFAIDRISGSNYFTRDADVILTMTDLGEEDCYGIEIMQRSFSDIKPFGVRWQNPIFVRDDSIDVTDIKQPGGEKKTDPITERMLGALHASNFEGGLAFTEFLRAVQIKGQNGKPTPGKTTFYRKLGQLIDRKMVEKSVATEKYLLSAEYAQKRADFFAENQGEVPP